MTRVPKIIAHRGYKQVTPENTMAAFESAVKAGADMIETDIHVCKSGEIVIMHDDNVSATSNGHGKISEMTLAELMQLDVGGWFGSAYTGQRIATLPELVSFFEKHPDLKLLLEFKGEWSESDCRKAIAALDAGNLRERTVLESFDTATMAALQKVAPSYDRGLLVEYPDPNYPVANVPTLPTLLSTCADLGVMCLNPSVRIMRDHPELLKQAHAAGLQVMVWTADEPADFELLTGLGVEAICTNRPAFLAGWHAGKESEVQ